MITQAPPPDAAGEIVRLVPREPTAAMVEAGGLSDGLVPEEFPGDGATLYPAKVWRAMWDAATPTDPLRSLSVGEADIDRQARELVRRDFRSRQFSEAEIDAFIGDPPLAPADDMLRVARAALSQSNAAQARGFAEGIEAAANLADGGADLADAARSVGGDEWRYARDMAEDIAEGIRALSQGSGSTDGGAGPVQMLLFCPNCGLKHVDEPDERTPDWTNPPHKSHLCHGCGCIWRPADVPTEGVNAIATIGKADTLDLNSVETLSRQPAPPASGDVGEMVERLRELLARATPGPWRLDDAIEDGWRDISGEGWTALARAAVQLDGRGCSEGEANATLIVEAVNALPTLLESLSRKDEPDGRE